MTLYLPEPVADFKTENAAIKAGIPSPTLVSLVMMLRSPVPESIAPLNKSESKAEVERDWKLFLNPSIFLLCSINFAIVYQLLINIL
ncbi:hypothetical protein H8S37_04680 [Mediterraneibacter sp. NSJ-55]|uniref:Uncharacterized protein n=1 Tax=Mediterraneibacter hominis TaxID=2763054 RepID=A0A923LHQ0_9FIRM|nr:hypothetical protein [Mediterraneibacter hominis]MBC5688224.1 hypothetical protein [Mediterraneibacter hominis]